MTTSDGSGDERVVLDPASVAELLDRLARAVLDRNGDAANVALVGIRTGGFSLAERLVRRLAALGHTVPLGAIDIALYRDDVFEGLPRPQVGSTELPFSLPGRTVVLVDDVLYTGRTVRAALDALVDHGRPRAVQLAVLVDRGHRELPIQADFVGTTLATSREEQVKVHLAVESNDDRVIVRKRRRA
ncbi:MAG: bifunctional pyr operon transcriptional regulator/uracil phosphoribosyltransferase PyrR [Deltaproteobacteria bacterium]|nr:bifunctional pyr operon transcriptional regulator/uracil phosphoribosyltransferase PyrR [Deltaproteobacteria bacterium]